MDNNYTAQIIHRSALRMLQMLRSTGKSTAVLSVLGCLYEQGPSTATQIAETLRIQPQSLTRLLSSLSSEGLIAKKDDPQDKRKSILELTDGGMDFLKTEIVCQYDLLAELMEKRLTRPEQQMLAIAAELLDKLSYEAVDPDR